MPLVDLKTDLKSLRYGNDTLGGGDSGQPYIQSAIPDNIADMGADKDFLLRGGRNNLQDSLTDVSRLEKMFFDLKSPSGLFFITKQQLLSRNAVRTQTSGGLLNDGAYSPLNTLAQAAGNSNGLHLKKQGLNPFEGTGAYSTSNKLYQNAEGVKLIAGQNNTNENRLFTLYQSTNQNDSLIGFPSSISPLSTTQKTFWKKLGFTFNNDVNVLSYNGGPDSILGIGKTNIRFATGARTGLNNKYAGGSTLEKQHFLGEGSKFTPVPQVDFRKALRNAEGNIIVDTTSSSTISKSPSYLEGGDGAVDGGVGLGRINQLTPGRRGNIINYQAGKKDSTGESLGAVDRINALPIYSSTAVTTSNIKNDLVKFRIAAINNDEPSFKTFMHFRALLGGMTDNFNATWNPTKYLGRGEDFYNYTGFTRTISLSWTVAAQSKEELIPMYKKLNYLASTTAPDYSPNGYMRGNLMQLTVGGYLDEQTGFFTSLTYTIPEDTTWEIAIGVDGKPDPEVKELPHRIEVQASFTPIHNFIPKKQINIVSNTSEDTKGIIDFNKYGPERFIALSDSSDTENKSNYGNVFEGDQEIRTIASFTKIPSKGLTLPKPQNPGLNLNGGLQPRSIRPINLP